MLLGLVAGMVALVLGHRYLPMNDAPSHIANAVIAADLWRGDPFFAEHYELQSIPLPYWAVALSLAPLQALLAPLLAFRLLVALYVVLLPLGFLALLRAAASPGEAASSGGRHAANAGDGRRAASSGGEPHAVSTGGSRLAASSGGNGNAASSGGEPQVAGADNRPLAAVAALMTMNWAYFLGEANFFLGQPLVLFALALFIRPGRLGAGRLVGFCLLAAAVYLCHIYALTALCGALFAFALQRTLTRGRPDLSPGQWAAAGWAAALFLLGAYYVLFAHGTDANTGGTWAFDFSPRKAAHLLIDPFDSPRSPWRPVMLGFVGALLAILFVPRLKALRHRPRATLAAALHWPLLAPALLLLAVAFLGPVGLLRPDGSLKEGEIAMRLLLCGWLLLLGGVRLAPAPWVRPVLLALLVLFGGFKLHDAYRLHRQVDRAVRAVSSTLLAQIPPRSRLLPLMELDPGEAVAADFLLHRIGNYVVIERHGYSPHVFAVLGQHPLRHRYFGDYRQVSQLQVSESEWRFYDYVLIQTRRREPRIPGLPEHADFIAASGDFQLFRIRRPGSP
ncbi:MAG TPA: hypothetical protein PLW65_13280 [Pseudomonadota bacterium]|nr:hypothetical protein [Pseudomonadota bacterium]